MADWVCVVVSETLWRYLSADNCKGGTAMKSLRNSTHLGAHSLWKPAVQGFGEDHTDPASHRYPTDGKDIILKLKKKGLRGILKF